MSVPTSNESDPFAEFVLQVIRDMRKPRQICICNRFRLTGEVEMDWHRCACRGWVSLIRICEEQSD